MDAVKAIVQKIVPEGKHGPFAFATCEHLDGSITFALESRVWEESEWPEEGMMVLLGDIRQKRAGWRAEQGRFWRLSDEQAQQIERSESVEREKEDDRNKKLGLIVARFGNLTAIDLTEDVKRDILIHLQLLAENYSSFFTYFGIQASSASNFLEDMKGVLEEWQKENIFKDNEIIRAIAQALITFYIGKERVREFAFITEAGWGHTIHDYNEHYISWCETTAGDFMFSLGFLEDALDLYYQALETAGSYYHGAAEHAKESMRKLAAGYRATRYESSKIENMISQQLTEIVECAGRETIGKIHGLPKWSYAECYWDVPLKHASKLLGEMGYSGPEQHQILTPAYKKVIPALIADREKIVKEQAEKYGKKEEEISWRSRDIAKLHRFIGDEEGFFTWELVYLNAEKMDIERSIAEYPDHIKELQKEKGPDYWVYCAEEAHKKRLVALKVIQARIEWISSFFKD